MTPEVILICGKIGSGKTTFARRLLKERPAVLLSCDELMLTLFGQQLGDRHDEVVRRTKDYLLNQSLEILKTGVSVILDWGFPTHREREETIAFFARRGFSCQGHYITASDEVLFENLRRRNLAVLAGTENAYYIDEAILQKFKDVFEEPDDTENMLRHEHFPRV